MNEQTMQSQESPDALTEAQLDQVFGGSGNPVDVEPDSKSTPILM